MGQSSTTSENRLRRVRKGNHGAGYYGDGPPDPRLPPYSATCQCTGCGEYFNSPAAFDMHRVGEPGVNRRCWTVAEMRAAGMSTNDRDLWVTRAYTPGLWGEERTQDG